MSHLSHKSLILLAIMTSMLSGSAIAQDRVSEKVRQKISANAIDTLIIYRFGCLGCIYKPSDTCRLRSQYLFWVKNGQYFMQKFGYCETPGPNELPLDNPLSFVLSNVDTLRVEELKYPKITRRIKMKDDTMRDTTEVVYMDHYSYHSLVMQAGEDAAVKWVPTYLLKAQETPMNGPNTNYESNRNSKLYTLIQKLEEFTKPNK